MSSTPSYENPALKISIILITIVLASSLALILFLSPSNVSDSEGNCGDNLHWKFENGTLVISGTGEMYDFSDSDKRWGGNEITKVSIEGAKSIGQRAFYSCRSLTEITISSSVFSIGNNAFQGCVSLSQITLPNALKEIDSNAFEGCITLNSLTIPSSVTTIGNYAFHSTALTEISIPSSVTSIGKWVFYSESLKTVKFESNINITLTGGTFYDCNSLGTIEISESADVVFGSNSIMFTDGNAHTINVKAPSGFTIPDDAKYGNITFNYLTINSKVA